MTRVERLDCYQRRHRWLGFPLGVLYKAADDRAPYLAALVTYYAFVSLFPLVLLFVSIAGFVLQSDPGLRRQLVGSAVANLPGIGSELRAQIGSFKGSGLGVVVGVIGLLYGALGATQAAQAAFNQIYAVPRNEQPNPLRSRLRSLKLLALLGTAVIVSSGINILVTTGNQVSAQLDESLRVLGFVVSLLMNFALFTLAFRLLTAIELRVRDVIVGGLLAGAAWQILQTFGSQFVAHQVRNSSALYGVFGVVLATLAYVYLEALCLMMAADINVVLRRHLWPRSLLTPFTDDVELTCADERVYTSYALAQRFKGWEVVETRFPARLPPNGDGKTATYADGRTGSSAPGNDLPDRTEGEADGHGPPKVDARSAGVSGIHRGDGSRAP